VKSTAEEEALKGFEFLPTTIINVQKLREAHVMKGKLTRHCTSADSPAASYGLPVEHFTDEENRQTCLNYHKYQVRVRRIFVRELGFRISYEDGLDPNFGILLAAFEPLTGVLSSFRDIFQPLMTKEFNWNIDQMNQEIASFHDKLYHKLSSSSAFEIFLKTSTLHLFAVLDKKVGALQLLKEAEEGKQEVKSTNTIQLKELENALPTVDSNNGCVPHKKKEEKEETGDDFAWNLSWKCQNDFRDMDYNLSAFLLERKELYLLTNHDHYYVYADLKSANFNALRLLNPELVLNAKTWEDLAAR
jgi:hypothetical protein